MAIESINASIEGDRRLAVADPILNRLIDYLLLLRRWNQRIRLVGSTDGAEAVAELLGDSLAATLVLKNRPRLVDVGSGAGLPGAVIAMAMPDTTVVTLEPIRKKHSFQRTARRELRIDNLEPRAIRIEALADGPFDAAISRATWPLVDWFRRAEAITKAGGRIVAFANEGAEVPDGGQVLRYRLPHRERCIVWMDLPKPSAQGE